MEVVTILKDNQQGLSVDLKGLVLINPATCYDRSSLAIKGPSVATYQVYYIHLVLSDATAFCRRIFLQQLLLTLAKAFKSVVDFPSEKVTWEGLHFHYQISLSICRKRHSRGG